MGKEKKIKEKKRERAEMRKKQVHDCSLCFGAPSNKMLGLVACECEKYEKQGLCI